MVHDFSSNAMGRITERSIRAIVPLKFSSMFSLNEVDLINRTQLSPTWLLEYVLCVWGRLDSQMRQNLQDEAFESIVDDIHQHITEHTLGNYNAVELVFQNHASDILAFCIRIYHALRFEIGQLAVGNKQFTLLAANVESIEDEHIVILMVYDDRYGGTETPAYSSL